MTRKQRETRRVKTTLSCNWGVTEDCPRNGTITSLSPKGCFVQTKAAVSEGAKLFLNLWLPSRRWLPLRGHILYHIPRVGFGLTFADLSANDQEMLELLIDYYEGEQVPDFEVEEE
jgi:PilZ domain